MKVEIVDFFPTEAGAEAGVFYFNRHKKMAILYRGGNQEVYYAILPNVGQPGSRFEDSDGNGIPDIREASVYDLQDIGWTPASGSTFNKPTYTSTGGITITATQVAISSLDNPVNVLFNGGSSTITINKAPQDGAIQRHDNTWDTFVKNQTINIHNGDYLIYDVWVDSDGDGTNDSRDAFPYDPTEDTDLDGDGVGANTDVDDLNPNRASGNDNDGDGIDDEFDPNDEDGPTGDLDGDGTQNKDDAFPNDPTEDTDLDGDGVGGNTDVDDSNPNKGSGADSDGDGIDDEFDDDIDGDGVININDDFPLDPNEDTDTDGDGTGDNADTDDDGDSILDVADADHPDNAGKPDTDSDGIIDEYDDDDDGDGVPDIEDADHPSNAGKSDADGDGIIDDYDTSDDRALSYIWHPTLTATANIAYNTPNNIDLNAKVYLSKSNNYSNSADASNLISETVSFTVVNGQTISSISNGVITFTDSGTVTVRMSFAGNGTYLPASSDFVFNLAWADSDGDGVADNNDNFPGDANRASGNDLDGDGLDDEFDSNDDDGPLGDLDNDGVLNKDDVNDNNPNIGTTTSDADGDGISDDLDPNDNDGPQGALGDPDGDGVPNNQDLDDNNPNIGATTSDADGDGISDDLDSNDNDGPLGDLDGDGVNNQNDAFPSDATEQTDSDADGIGDNADTDHDNDGVSNVADADHPSNAGKLDTDGDGIIDDYDPDIDGDGVPNASDYDPTNAAVTSEPLPITYSFNFPGLSEDSSVGAVTQENISTLNPNGWADGYTSTSTSAYSMSVFYTGSTGRTDGVVDLENFVDANLNQWTVNNPSDITWSFASNRTEGHLVNKYNGVGGGTRAASGGVSWAFNELGTLSGPRNNILTLSHPTTANFADFHVVRVMGYRANSNQKVTIDLLVVMSHAMGDVDQDGTWNQGDSMILSPHQQTTQPAWLDARKSYYVVMDTYNRMSGRYYYAGLYQNQTLTNHYHHLFRGGHDFESWIMTYSSQVSSRYKLGRTSETPYVASNSTYNPNFSIGATYYTNGDASAGLGAGAYAFSPADMFATWTGGPPTITHIVEGAIGTHTGFRT